VSVCESDTERPSSVLSAANGNYCAGTACENDSSRQSVGFPPQSKGVNTASSRCDSLRQYTSVQTTETCVKGKSKVNGEKLAEVAMRKDEYRGKSSLEHHARAYRQDDNQISQHNLEDSVADTNSSMRLSGSSNTTNTAGMCDYHHCL